MKILGIETSCDETAISILEYDAKKRRSRLLVNFVYSQIAVHQPFGGVVPNLAKREHQKNLVPILEMVFKKAGLLRKQAKNTRSEDQLEKIKDILIKEEDLAQNLINFLKKYQKPKIDLIAITKGPGLAPALWPGVNSARALSYFWNIPLIGINHLEGHILANWLPQKEKEWTKIKISNNIFPAIALVISGGHTQLVLMKKIGQYRVIGETRDDAAGECFDKTARLLELGYPGGPAIAAEAAKFKILNLESQIILPRPMLHSNDYDFSFAGLKTAVLYLIEKLKKEKINWKNLRPAIAYEIQNSINEVLIFKTLKATKNFRAKSIILGGGVSANQSLKDLLTSEVKIKLPNIKLIIPKTEYTGDNSAMIAFTALFKKERDNWQTLEADPNLRLEK